MDRKKKLIEQEIREDGLIDSEGHVFYPVDSDSEDDRDIAAKKRAQTKGASLCNRIRRIENREDLPSKCFYCDGEIAIWGGKAWGIQNAYPLYLEKEGTLDEVCEIGYDYISICVRDYCSQQYRSDLTKLDALVKEGGQEAYDKVFQVLIFVCNYTKHVR